MKNSNDQLQRLFDKSEWTNEEKQWLLNYLEDADGEELEAIMKAKFEKDQEELANETAFSNDVLKLIHERIGVEQRTSDSFILKMNIARILAAASVIGLLIFGASILLKKDTKNELAEVKHKKELPNNDVLPGANKALLTLADGSTIILNDEQNGELAQQGYTKVLKIDGKLMYESSDTTAGKILYNSITTPRGGQYQIVLADGSAVWLNAASSLRFPTAFNGKERRVEISGEAYFEVVKSKNMPFVVSVNGAEVQVLGTHFNVMAYKDEAVLKTTLLEGAVKFVNGSNAVILKPGQQSQLNENGNVHVVKEIDVEKVVSWKNGYFDFDGEDIETITKQLSRWYDIEVISTKTIADRFYAEIPRKTKLSDALHALELTGKVRFTLEGRKLIVKP